MLYRVKLALRIRTSAFDEELTDMIEAAKKDLQIAGVSKDLDKDKPDPLLLRAVITYCKLHFGDAASKDTENLKRSYDEQKAQLSMATGYTDWGEDDDV